MGDRQEGFFIEAGAYDGYEFSVSYLFECAGWSGLLVEPLADRAAQAANRRKASRVVTAALSRPGAPQSATFRRDEIEWYSKLGDDGEQGNVVEVTTLDALLEGHTGGIDFVVLDLEGHELTALEGFASSGGDRASFSSRTTMQAVRSDATPASGRTTGS